MDLPVGSILAKNLILKEINLENKINSFLEKDFRGYLVLTAAGRAGIEEGAILIQKNELIGAVFEYLRFKKRVYGELALRHYFNAAKADFGVMDVVSLSKQQIELIIAFNEKIELAKHLTSKEIAKIVPRAYDAKTAESFLGDELQKQESRFDVFKRVGLAEFSRKIG
ncbi:MAG: DUF2226 domain-containing protein [Candidatus Diapherotrites archaeon]|nr:DUF2226 domain-containing protein [Candidatus Diapherotrites archaeon]